MADIENVYLAIFERIEALKPVGVDYVAPNVDFNPGEGWYFEAGFYPNGTKGEGLASGMMSEGLLVLTAVFRKGESPRMAYEAAKLLKAMFPKGLKIPRGGETIKFGLEPRDGSPFTDETKFRVPVTMEWTC